MELDIEEFNRNGGYNPYKLEWGQEITFPSTRRLNEYGNRIYNRYPARSIFLVPRATLNHKSSSKKEIKVLDPFMGSGTTAVEASLLDLEIFGVEMDPFARLIGEASILRFSEKEFEELNTIYREVKSAYKDYKFEKSKFYPDLKNVEYWFHEEVFNELLALKAYIFSEIEQKKFKLFFKIVFADCIKPSSKMERQSTKPYISSKYKKKIKPVSDSFEYSYNKHILAYKQFSNHKSGSQSNIQWAGNDATNFKTVQDIDIAITSPPYLNAFDYTQIIKIESSWLSTLKNTDIEKLRKLQVGHHKRISGKNTSDVKKVFEPYYNQLLSNEKVQKKMSNKKLADSCLEYFEDIYKNLKCVFRSLKKGGEYHIVIGDNNVRGIEIPTHKLIADLALKIGFDWFGYYKYPIKDHRTSIPRKNTEKIKYEFVLMLRK